MKIKASKVFANFVNQVARETGKQFHASIIALSPLEYETRVGDVMDAEMFGDWDYTTGRARALCISYPENYYACSALWSSGRLCAEFRRRGVRDVAGLREMIVDLFEI